MLRLDIFSDPVCPWCYIGKGLLDRALAARPGHAVLIAWHPFQLNPDMAPGGADRDAYLQAKFGGPGSVRRAAARVEQAARLAGLGIDLAAATRIPNTLDAHRLIHWAGMEGLQDRVVSRLFGAYFREGRDIGDRGELAVLAGEAGFEPAVASRLLASDADRDHIRARDRHARDRGVTAVPTFVVADRYVLTGAQAEDLWTRVIDDIVARGATR
jgi:predicted DsbA family dithiol-disulfide isomerase